MASTISKLAGGKSSVVKVVGLFKRKKGMSVEAFRNYYENNHIKLFEQHLSQPGVLRYARRYLTQIPGLASPLPATGGYDVIMEIWYSDRELFESLRNKPDPDFVKIAIQDEEKFLDRESMSIYLSEDVESKDGPWDV